MRLYRLAAERGSPEAMGNLSLEYMKGQAVPKDEKLSFEWAWLRERSKASNR